MRKITAIIALLGLSAATAAAEDITVTPGNLQGQITDQSTVSTLSLNGSIDAADLDFIAHSLSSLRTLDLSNCRIEAYKGAPLSSGRTSSPANVLPEYSLAGCPAVTVILPMGVTSLSDGSLAASSIESIVIPEGVDSIGTATFDGCKNLRAVSFPSSLTAIGDLAFKGCSSLSMIQLPANLATIGREAFESCTSLESVVMYGNVTNIGDNAFNDCSALADVTFSPSLRSIGADAFNGTALESVDLTYSDKLHTIGNWAFAHNSALAEVYLPASVTTLGDGVFFDCSALKTVTMPQDLVRLSPYLVKGTAIDDASQLFNDKVTEVGEYALYGVDKLKKLTLPASVQNLGDRAMANMSSLVTLDVVRLKKIPTLGTDVFANTASDNVTLLSSSNLAPAFKATPQWQEFNVVVDESTATPIISDSHTALQVKCDGTTLSINAPHAMDIVTLYTVDGRLISRTAVNSDTTTDIDVSALNPASTVIVTILFENSARTSLKIKI